MIPTTNPTSGKNFMCSDILNLFFLKGTLNSRRRKTLRTRLLLLLKLFILFIYFFFFLRKHLKLQRSLGNSLDCSWWYNSYCAYCHNGILLQQETWWLRTDLESKNRKKDTQCVQNWANMALSPCLSWLKPLK